MNDDLLGYVLELLEDHEAEAVRSTAETHAVAQTHIEALRRHLTIFEVSRETIAAPDGLAHRTCQRVRAFIAEQRPGGGA